MPKEKMLPMDVEGVKTKMGVYPESIIDYLALIGDTSDNVPGVFKCGHKTALKWLDAYGDIDGIIENRDAIGGKVGQYLAESIDTGSLLLSRKLVTIKRDVEIEKFASEFKAVMDEEKLLELLNLYELRGFKKSLNLIDKNADSAVMDVITDHMQVQNFVSNMHLLPIVFMKTFSYKDKSFILAGSQNEDFLYVFEPKDFIPELKLMVDSYISNKGYISSVDSKSVLKEIYKQVQDRKVFDLLLDDARVVSYIQEGGRSKVETIEMLNETYSNFNLSDLRETYKLNGKSPKWAKMTLEETISVHSEEVKIGKYIINNKESDFDLNSGLMDNKLLGVLAYMEDKGTLIDVEYLKSFNIELEEKVKALETSIFEVSKEEFNIGSPKQVANILFNVLEIPSKKKSTSEDVLLALVDDNPIVGDILKWRSLTKLQSTYVEGLISRVDENNFIHTTYNSTLTTTSRLSSTDPNLQNIPVKSEDGRKIRKAFVHREGYKILKIDYSQIELRILAHLSNDKKLIEAYVQDQDLHAITASQIFEIAVEDVTYEQRQIGKTINFGLIYGMSERRLAAELGIEKKVASTYYRNYFRYFKGVKPFFESELEKARENLFVETVSGRKIPTKDLKSPNPHARSHAEKAANNAAIQGTAADIIKVAMNRIFDFLQESEIDANLLMQVHDELIFEVREDIVEGFADEIKTLMENTTLLSIPLIVECSIGDSY